jgi:hypothetical protein
VQLPGEQVDTQVAVLARSGGGRDPDDLAGTTLEGEQIAFADVVARDGDCVWRGGDLDGARSGAGGGSWRRNTLVLSPG